MPTAIHKFDKRFTTPAAKSSSPREWKKHIINTEREIQETPERRYQKHLKGNIRNP